MAGLANRAISIAGHNEGWPRVEWSLSRVIFIVPGYGMADHAAAPGAACGWTSNSVTSSKSNTLKLSLGP